MTGGSFVTAPELLAFDTASAMAPLTVEVDLILETDDPSPIEQVELADLVQRALDQSGATGCWSIAVVLTSDRRLRDLHRDFMGIDEETDVMTFPTVDDATGAVRGGDVVISVERAAAQAADQQHDAAEEIRFLVVHGLLHLVGWDDATGETRSRMHARQSEILREFAQQP
jgi:probable rRNA maturation factor